MNLGSGFVVVVPAYLVANVFLDKKTVPIL
jgi:hypothetical protein